MTRVPWRGWGYSLSALLGAPLAILTLGLLSGLPVIAAHLGLHRARRSGPRANVVFAWCCVPVAWVCLGLAWFGWQQVLWDMYRRPGGGGPVPPPTTWELWSVPLIGVAVSAVVAGAIAVLVHADRRWLAASCIVLLAACADGEDQRKGAESDVIHDVSVPTSYEVVSEYESGNGGGGPVLVYQSTEGSPVIEDMQMPDGYRSLSLKAARWEVWVPGLDRSVDWRSTGYFRGPTPDGEGECDISVAFGRVEPVVSLMAACVLEGRMPPILPDARK